MKEAGEYAGKGTLKSDHLVETSAPALTSLSFLFYKMEITGALTSECYWAINEIMYVNAFLKANQETEDGANSQGESH